ncbi:MAG: DUF3833 family protein [Alphaproteobacteria bacterium]|nr:DUF3833 family protein [Alphaproteobacteria bacterium]
MIRRAIAVVSIALTVAGCSAMKIEDFAGRQPELRLETYFAGRTRAWGIFEDRFANLKREFTVDIDGTWNGTELVLDERFNYKDGEKDRRIWHLKQTAPGVWEGRTDDAIGVAHGRQAGNAFNFNYDINLKMGDGLLTVHFNDWLYLQPDGVLLNRAYVTKWGFDVGSVTLAFRKADEAAAGAGKAAE